MGKIRSDEKLFRVNDSDFLHIQECDDGYDFTYFLPTDTEGDRVVLVSYDGGQLDEPDISIYDATHAILTDIYPPVDRKYFITIEECTLDTLDDYEFSNY